MTRIARSVLIARPVARVFDLINDVEEYPNRFDWCREAVVLERHDDGLTARLDVQYAGFNAAFTTRNRVKRLRRIDLTLVEGPFSDLTGSWKFTKLGDAGCRVELQMDFEFAGRWVGSALALGFQGLADKMVDDFSRAARSLDD